MWAIEGRGKNVRVWCSCCYIAGRCYIVWNFSRNELFLEGESSRL